MIKSHSYACTRLRKSLLVPARLINRKLDKLRSKDNRISGMPIFLRLYIEKDYNGWRYGVPYWGRQSPLERPLNEDYAALTRYT